MQRDPRVLLHDVNQAIERLRRFTHDRSFSDYRSDELLKSAVERQLSIIGEALWRLRSSDATTAAEIRDVDRIVAFRHVLVHGYTAVDDRLVWGIIESRIGDLEEDTKCLLAELERGSS